MISLPKIVALARTERHEDLLEAVLRNGRALPLHARLRLASPEGLPGAALGLGARRLLELTLGLTPQATELLLRLLDRQQADGSFGSPAATAAALGALHAASDALAWAGSSEGALSERVETAAAGALASLRSQRQADLTGAPLIGDSLDSLLVLTLLGGDARAEEALGLSELLATLEGEGLHHDRALSGLMERAGAMLAGANRHEQVAA